MYPLILENIFRHVTLDTQEQAHFTAALQHRTLRKKEFILQEGELCRYDHFVIKGSLRQYEIDEEGREHIMQFAFEDWWIGDWYSMLTNTPSVYNIDALEDAEVLLIDKNRLEQLFLEIPKLERYFRIIMQHAFVAQQRRILFLQKPAEERYADFYSRYGHFEQRVPQQQIASYLGITRETLNRVKNKQ